jgi:hypothetical protein
LIPIAGKAYLQLVVRDAVVGAGLGSFLYLQLPILAALGIGIWQGVRRDETGRAFAMKGLLAATWIAFYLNRAFFLQPWPWREWTGRTPSGILFFLCVSGLTAVAMSDRERDL